VSGPENRPAPRPRPKRPHPPSFYRKARLRRNLRLLRALALAGAVVVLGAWGVRACSRLPIVRRLTSPAQFRASADPADAADGIKIGTFLGNEQRRFYGKGPVPERLDVIWKTKLGSGWTSRKGTGKPVLWSGTGWTGQCTLVRDKGKLSLLVNGYDHRMHRIDAATGDVIWESPWDDVIKSTNTVFVNPKPTGSQDRYVVTAGSRRGFPLSMEDPRIAPYRAISFGNGKELWRLPAPRTRSYSRDVDASGLLIDGRVVIAVESGYVYLLDPARTLPWGKERQPVVVARSPELFTARDVQRHNEGGASSNLCIEASPSLLGDVIYIPAGSGHVYGLARKDLKVVWDFFIGSDLDGSAVVTRDDRLLVPVERQYISGHGGVYMLDPKKPPKDAVLWYFPTENRGISEWEGGVIGSVGINDEANTDRRLPALAAFNSVDGKLYVVSRDEMAEERTEGPNGEKGLRKPRLVFSANVGCGISTPIIVDDRIISTGFDNKVHLYRIDYLEQAPNGRQGAWLKSGDGQSWFVSISETASFASEGPFEATPIVWKGRVYVGSRDGWLYCLGDKSSTQVEVDPATARGD
jgi:outer membrane protein assembly factor BamB